MKSDEYIASILEAGRQAAKEQLLLDKNRRKPEFYTTPEALFFYLAKEVEELSVEVSKRDWERIYCEAGDVINFASALAKLAKENID